MAKSNPSRAVAVNFILGFGIMVLLGTVAPFAFGPRAEEQDDGLEPYPGEGYAAVQGNEVLRYQPYVELLDDGRLLVPFENVTDEPIRVAKVLVVDADDAVRENRVDFTLQPDEKLCVYLTTPPVKILGSEPEVLTLEIYYQQSGRTKITVMELYLDEDNIHGVLQDQGEAFLVSDIHEEMTVPPIVEGTQLFSVSGKVQVDALGEISAQTDGDTKCAEQNRTFTLSLEASQMVTVTAIAVIGIDNDFSVPPVTLEPGKAVEFLLQRVPPVVMSVGDFESLAIDVEGTIGGEPFIESFTLNLHSTNTIGNGHLQGSIVPASWEEEGFNCPIEMREKSSP